MLDSNYYILKHVKLSPSEQARRAEYLENSLAQLKAYHLKAKPEKRRIVNLLICAYDELLERFRS